VTNRRKHKGVPKKDSQEQYLVHWEPAVEEQWALEAYQACGYAVQSSTPITFEDLREHEELFSQLSCEMCNRPDQEQCLLVCDSCTRMYHQHCCNIATHPIGKWTCNYCMRKQHQHGTRLHNPTDLRPKLHIVQLAPSWEPAGNIPDYLLEAWRIKRDTPAPPKPRPDAHMTELQKQGIHGPNKYARHMTDRARHNVTIEHQAVDPHTDIAATQQYELQVRDVPRTFQTQDGMRTVRADVACCIGADGRCIGTVDPARLQLLHDRYQWTMENNHAAVAHLNPAGFQEEVYKLLLRYRDGTGREDSSRSVNMRNHWTTPPEVMRVLQTHLGITQERFASPLNFCDNIPQYWSCHERDQVFAAHWDSYSCQWRGTSQANPEYEHEEMSKQSIGH
jgi:hypothetical protein